MKAFMISTISVMVACFTSGCVTFADMQVDKIPSQEIARRNNFIPTAEWRRHLGQLVGTILLEKTAGAPEDRWVLGSRFIKAGKEPIITLVPKDQGVLAQFLIDNSADVTLKALGVGSGSLSGKQKMSFTYADSADAFISFEDIDRDALRAEANKPMPAGVTKRYFIQAALLADIQRRLFTEVSGGLTKTVAGDGIGADGKVYSSNTKFVQDYSIHLTLRDLDDFKGEKALVEILSDRSRQVQGLLIISSMKPPQP